MTAHASEPVKLKAQRLADGDTVTRRLARLGATGIAGRWDGNRLRVDFHMPTARIDLVRNAVVSSLAGTAFEHQATADGDKKWSPPAYYTNLLWRRRL